jgi:hypothetical protein
MRGACDRVYEAAVPQNKFSKVRAIDREASLAFFQLDVARAYSEFTGSATEDLPTKMQQLPALGLT